MLAALRNAAIGLRRDAGWTTSAAGRRDNAWRLGATSRFLGLPAL